MDASTGPGVALTINLSADGLYAAQINGKDLVVYNDLTSANRDAQVCRLKENGVKYIKFSQRCVSMPATNNGQTRFLLTANDSRITAWQLNPLQVLGEIENLEPGTLAVDFGKSGQEILVFHAWNTKLTIHSLETGQSSVIKSPKSASHLGFGYRPVTRHLAILLKHDMSDLLTIHEPRSHELLGRVTLSTVDAQGLKWSPDGNWIAVWDAAMAGTRVLILTADGQIYRTYHGSPDDDDPFDLGVRHIEWAPSEGAGEASRFLAVGKVNGSIDLLGTRTFSLSTTLSHIFAADTQTSLFWRERFTSAMGDGDYTETSSSSAANMSPESPSSARGVSIMTFSSDGGHLATVDSTRSNVVWIWAMNPTPQLTSVLVHEQPVRQLLWHPATPQLLINTITTSLPSIRWWSPNTRPVIARVPTHKSESGKYDVKWLAESEPDSAFWFGSTEEYVVGYLSAEDGPSVKFEVITSVTSQGYGKPEGCVTSS
ncbi:hypothetical protein N7539_002356 [Penicillium diatomitis]|uniref:Uncharacterized protein n=1 Tax=Penicillium diatomitis TaxID=2819901 RepID=A0A9W9XEN3_9EURO|nr:uncharacterized protein N7539_002356 [Penicillium diatomitis]KAJ5490789.1 hypothetical protein N7539_002356 [Penicillium diatomitis]